MTTVISEGFGFNVDHDFYRAPFNMPIVIDPKAYAKPGHVIGTIDGIPDASVSFMRRPKIRVHVRKDGIKEI